jgi:hypothetical protein
MKYLIILISTLLFTYNVRSQDIEIGPFIGVSQYLGDLQYSHVIMKESRMAVGGLFRYYFSPKINLKFSGIYGRLYGNDDYQPREPGRPVDRGFNFKSHIVDFSAQVEYNILPFVSGHGIKRFAPYIFTGISVFNFNPKAFFNGDWHELQPLGTEGQGIPGYADKYKLTQISIPYGLGLKYSFRFSRRSRGINLYMWNIGLEIQHHKTFTDHIDDVGGEYPNFKELYLYNGELAYILSDRQGAHPYQKVRSPHSPRGDKEDMDTYIFYGIFISKTFRQKSCYAF